MNTQHTQVRRRSVQSNRNQRPEGVCRGSSGGYEGDVVGYCEVRLFLECFLFWSSNFPPSTILSCFILSFHPLNSKLFELFELSELFELLNR